MHLCLEVHVRTPGILEHRRFRDRSIVSPSCSLWYSHSCACNFKKLEVKNLDRMDPGSPYVHLPDLIACSVDLPVLSRIRA